MKRPEGNGRETRNVLRSGAFGKPRLDPSKPKLTLDLSSKVYSFQQEASSEQKTSSRRKSIGVQSCRSQNKENKEFNGNQRVQSTKSKDMLESYRSSRNTHYLQRNDIFKFVKPLHREDFDFKVKTNLDSEHCKSGVTQVSIQVPPSSEAKQRDHENSPPDHRLEDVAKKINFNPAGRDSLLGSSYSSLGLTNLQMSYINHQGHHEGKRDEKLPLEELKNFNNRTGKEIFANRRLSSNTRSESRSNVRNKMADEFSDPSALETVELLRNWDRRVKTETTENSLKLCLSYYDPRPSHQEGYRAALKADDKRVASENSYYLLNEVSQVGEPSDGVLITNEENTNSFDRDKKDGRAANLESMKTIKEVEEKEELMGYTSQKESHQSNFNQGSFQNLIDKYCKTREQPFVPNSGRDSLERTQSGFVTTQTTDLQINAINAIQEEELNQEIDYQDTKYFDKKFESLAARFPALSIAHSTKSTEMSNMCKEKSHLSSQDRDGEVDRENRRAMPFSLLVNTGDCLKTEVSEEKSTSRGHSRSMSTYSRAEKLDAELEKLLRNMEQDSKVAQERNMPNYNKSTFRRLDDISDPTQLKNIIRELEIEKREKEAELINMNMQVKDLSRLSRVLVRKLRSSRNHTN